MGDNKEIDRFSWRRYMLNKIYTQEIAAFLILYFSILVDHIIPSLCVPSPYRPSLII